MKEKHKRQTCPEVLSLPVIIINNCRDPNASGRQQARVSSLGNNATTFIGVKTDIEAAGNVVDAIDALTGSNPSLVLVNVAPRNGVAKKFPNGSPFGYFRHGKTVVAGTVDGLTFSLAKKVRLFKEIRLLDVEKSITAMIRAGYMPGLLSRRASASQFRSFDFLPFAATFLVFGHRLPGKKVYFDEMPDAPRAVWWIDNFGNCKLTDLAENPSCCEDGSPSGVFVRGKELPFYHQLRSVPCDRAAIIVGSSGFGGNRFLEIIVQGGNAAARFNLEPGQTLEEISYSS